MVDLFTRNPFWTVKRVHRHRNIAKLNDFIILVNGDCQHGFLSHHLFQMTQTACKMLWIDCEYQITVLMNLVTLSQGLTGDLLQHKVRWGWFLSRVS